MTHPIKVDNRSLVSATTGCDSVCNNPKLSIAKGVWSACCVTMGPECWTVAMGEGESGEPEMPLLLFRRQGPNELQAPAAGLRLPAGDQQAIPGELRPHPRPPGRPLP